MSTSRWNPFTRLATRDELSQRLVRAWIHCQEVTQIAISAMTIGLAECEDLRAQLKENETAAKAYPARLQQVKDLREERSQFIKERDRLLVELEDKQRFIDREASVYRVSVERAVRLESALRKVRTRLLEHNSPITPLTMRLSVAAILAIIEEALGE